MSRPAQAGPSGLAGRAAAAWQGRLPLWLTYWVLGVGGNMTFVSLLLLVYSFGGLAARPLLWAVYLLSLAWFVFIFGAIWRAAGAYRGARIWAFLARAGVCVGIVRMAAEALVLVYLPSVVAALA